MVDGFDYVWPIIDIRGGVVILLIQIDLNSKDRRNEERIIFSRPAYQYG